MISGNHHTRAGASNIAAHTNNGSTSRFNKRKRFDNHEEDHHSGYNPSPRETTDHRPCKRGRKSDWGPFERAREELRVAMHELDFDRRTGPNWIRSYADVRVGDMVHYPHVVACKDRNMLATDKHEWLPSLAGDLLVKYRWGIVIAKQRGRLLIKPCYTFSHTPRPTFRKNTSLDEVTGEHYHIQRDYVHVVPDEGDNKAVENEAECFEDGRQLRCRRVDGCFKPIKNCFMSIHETYVLEDGAPIQVRARLVSKEDVAFFRRAHAKSMERTETALQNAETNWIETPVVSTGPDTSRLSTHGDIRPVSEATASMPPPPKAEALSTADEHIGPFGFHSQNDAMGPLDSQPAPDVKSPNMPPHERPSVPRAPDDTQLSLEIVEHHAHSVSSDARMSTTLPAEESSVSRTSRINMPPSSRYSNLGSHVTSSNVPAQRSTSLNPPNTLMNNLGMNSVSNGSAGGTPVSQPGHQRQGNNTLQPRRRLGDMPPLPNPHCRFRRK